MTELNARARRRLQSVRWARTAIGAPASWPREWTLALELCLSSSLPMVLALGPELESFCNDGYAYSVGLEEPLGFEPMPRSPHAVARLLRHVACTGEPMLMLNVHSQRQRELGVSCHPLQDGRASGASAVAIDMRSHASVELLTSLHDMRTPGRRTALEFRRPVGQLDFRTRSDSR